MSERFMRQHYGASGYVDPHVAYEAAHTQFDTYWSQQPPHLRQDDRYRAIAAKAYLAAKGFELGGARYQRAEREGI